MSGKSKKPESSLTPSKNSEEDTSTQSSDNDGSSQKKMLEDGNQTDVPLLSTSHSKESSDDGASHGKMMVDSEEKKQLASMTINQQKQHFSTKFDSRQKKRGRNSKSRSAGDVKSEKSTITDKKVGDKKLRRSKSADNPPK